MAFLVKIEHAQNIEELQEIFSTIKSYNFKDRPDLFKKLIDAKDKRKLELTVIEFQQEIIDAETGEIK